MKDGSCLYLIFIATLFLCSVYCIPLNNLESDSKFLKEGVLEDLNDEFNCTFRCSIGEGLNVCDCDDVNPPIKIDHNLKIAEDLKIAEAMKTPENLEIIQKAKESNVTECQIKCESTGDGYPFCDDCDINVPIKIAQNLKVAEDLKITEAMKTPENLKIIQKAKESNVTECEIKCESTGDGFPFCDNCTDFNPPIKIDQNLKIAGDLKITEAMKTSQNLEIIQKAKESNLTECQIKCESTGDGYPFCNCGNNVPPKSEKKEKIDIDCEELCENGDGFPFCDCSVIPDPKNGNKKPFSKHLNKKTLPIKLEKTRIKKP